MKRTVQIIVPEVHDGLGGVHYHGSTPELPGNICDLFVERGCAVEIGGEQPPAEAEDEPADEAPVDPQPMPKVVRDMEQPNRRRRGH